MKRTIKLLSLLAVCAIALTGGIAGAARAETGADLWTVTGATGEDGTITLEKTDGALSQTMTTRANYSNFELEFTIAENLTRKYDGTNSQRQLGFEVRFGDNSALRFAAGADGNHDNGQWGGGEGNASTDGIWLHASPFSVIAGGKELEKALYVPETGKIKMTVSDGKLSLLYGKESAHRQNLRRKPHMSCRSAALRAERQTVPKAVFSTRGRR